MNPCFYRPIGKIDRRSRCFANSVRVLSGIRSGSHADCTPTPFKLSRPEEWLVDQELKKLLQKGAIEVVEHTENQFSLKHFHFPKKDGTRRPVIDLRQLNQFAEKVPFKMEDLTQIPSVLQKGGFSLQDRSSGCSAFRTGFLTKNFLPNAWSHCWSIFGLLGCICWFTWTIFW